MSAQHTPGPWTLETVKTSVGHCHKIGPFPSFDEARKTYACVYVDGYGLRRGAVWDELLANARLIDAAPELLEACESALNHIRALGLNRELTDQLSAAIAKAKGEQ